MRLMHFSTEPVTEVRSVEQGVIAPRDFGPKPRGLWVSDEDEYGWSQWCKDEEFGDYRVQIPHEVKLVENDGVLLLSTETEIDIFTEAYGHRTDPNDPTLHYYWINWPEVAKLYQGIIISPYIGSRRMTSHTSWYYTWDCASGCIWDSAAIESIRILESA